MSLSTSPAFFNSFQDDGFVTTAAEPWFKVKVQLIQQYFESFITNVSGKVNDIVFVDLYSGSGLYSIGHQKQLFPSVALTSLQDNLPVSKWIFCEQSSENAKALKIRVNKYFRGKNVVIFESKPEQLLEKFRSYVPQSKGSYKVAVFCVVDPFSFGIPFTTLDKLNDLGFTFLIPYTFSLTGRLNYRFYLRDQRERLTRYLGGFKDIEKLDEVNSNVEFYRKLVKIQQNNMLMLGLNTTVSVHKLSSGLMELPFYYMGFYSKQLSAKTVSTDIQRQATTQFQLF
ncbi:MAG TPA: three-Cys-motif partner protein TcmP [Cyclobacteriaceae bacterium]|nr:three-Cys-motif partner protein TcmP [Cyclobacteriaceae bacterium]